MPLKSKLQHTKSRLALALLAAFLLPMMTAGCQTLSGDPPLRVDLPAECDRNAKPVPYPPIIKEDLGLRSARFAAGMKLANGRLEAVAVCNAKVRDLFAKSSKN